MLELISENRIYWGKNGTGAPQLKRYLSEVQQGAVPTTWWTHEFAGHTDAARKEIKELFGTTAVFDTPKSSQLLQRLLQVGTSGAEDEIILDFFAGSGTTSHAVLKQNLEDSGKRKWIMVQLPEPLPRVVDGNRTIVDVARNRFRKATQKISSAFTEQLAEREVPLDTGFRAFRLTDTNFSQWSIKSDTSPEDLEDLLDELADSTRDDATPEQLLFELLLKIGFGLSESIAVEEISGLEVFSVAEGLVLAYVNEHMKPTLEQFRGLVAQYPAKLVVLEDCIKDDEIKTNLMQECRSHGVELWTA